MSIYDEDELDLSGARGKPDESAGGFRFGDSAERGGY